MSEEFERKLMKLEVKKNNMMYETSDDYFDDENEYRSFIPSEFKWMSLDKQKKRAKYLGNITKQNKK